jgi:hypothetical protein
VIATRGHIRFRAATFCDVQFLQVGLLMTRANDASVELHLTGPAGSKFASFSDFVSVCQTMRNTIRHVERCLTGRESSVEYEVLELNKASARLVIGASHPSERSLELFGLHRETVRRLQCGERPDARLDHAALTAFKGFSTPLRGNGTRLSVGGTMLTEEFRGHVDRWLEPESVAAGTISGMMDGFDFHGRYRFTLYTAIGDHEIQCDFNPAMLAHVLSCAKKHVTAHGNLHYVAGRPYPVRAEIDSVEVHPGNDDLADLLDLCGVAAGDGEQDSVHTVRLIRDEW